MPLKISLKPGERFAINGAVIANGDKRASLVLQNKAAILRERDIIQAEDVNTPLKRIYFPIQMMYLDDGNESKYYQEFQARMDEFLDVVSHPEIISQCVKMNKDIANHDYYGALKTCRSMFELEEQLLQVNAG